MTTTSRAMRLARELRELRTSAQPRPPRMDEAPTGPPARRPETELLARVPLFAGLSPADRRRVAELAEDTAYNAGRVIVKRGDPARAFYVIVDGRAKS